MNTTPPQPSPPSPPRSPLETKIAELPAKPGCYLMRSESGEVIYVGKAKVLRNRVRSYFQAGTGKDDKTRALVRNIVDFETIVTQSEIEALILECSLIKKYRPRYNIMLKDDKTYPYIKISYGETYPRLFITRRVSKGEKARYLGPYTDTAAARELVRLARELFGVRSCDHTLAKPLERPCLDYDMGKCPAPCVRLVTADAYRERVKKAEAFVTGDRKGIAEDLAAKMQAAAARFDYEAAARHRDRLRALESIQKRTQRVVVADLEDRDVIGIARGTLSTILEVFFVRSGAVVGRRRFPFQVVHEEKELLPGFLKQFYSGGEYVPPEILLPFAPDDGAVIATWLGGRRGGAVALTVPARGPKRDLVNLAMENARQALVTREEELAGTDARRREGLSRVAELLGLPAPPRRIECFDISNVAGTHAVASMVVLEDGTPLRNHYRKFKIKTVTGSDDFAMMREAVLRRYTRLKDENGPWPDLILVDGGAIQLEKAREALDEIGLGHLETAGLAKRFEEVYRPGVAKPVNPGRNDPGILMLRRIRDEAHRFAIGFHRQLRGKAMIESVLDKVADLGEKRKALLYEAFGDLTGIMAASAEEIESVEGFGEILAAKVHEALHPEDEGDETLAAGEEGETAPVGEGVSSGP